MPEQPPITPKFTAAVDLLRRSGASQIQIRYQDDDEPTVWIVVAVLHDWLPGWSGTSRGPAWEIDAGSHPEQAVLRLCERLVNGGLCVHCQKPTMLELYHDSEPVPGQGFLCVTAWDPELATFRRGCE